MALCPGRPPPTASRAPDLDTPCRTKTRRENSQDAMQDGMRWLKKKKNCSIHSLHMASSKKFSGKKSSVVHISWEAPGLYSIFDSSSLFLIFLNQRVLCSLLNNLGLVLIFHLGYLKCSRETVLPFRYSKYIREPLLFLKVTGIFLGNCWNPSGCSAFHVFSCF